MSSIESTSAGSPAARRSRRAWIPLCTFAAWGAGVLLLRIGVQSDVWPIDPGVGNLATMAATLFAGLIVLVWWTFLAGQKGALRWAPAVVVVCAAAYLLVRYEIRFTGDMQVNLFDRWNMASLEALPRQGADELPQVDASAENALRLDFPQFGGPNRDGSVPGVRLARDWESNPPQLLWKQEIGQGWSGFAVVDRHAVTLEQRAAQGETTSCYDLLTGTLLWAQSTVDAEPTFFDETLGGPGPRSTPTIVGQRVFTLGATGVLNCFDLATGDRIWTVDILADNDAENANWGRSCSPLAVDDKIVVSAGGSDGKSLVAYDQSTGRRSWSGGDRFSSYASPAIGVIAGVRQILMVNEDWLTAHDAADGKVLWEYNWPGNSGSNASASQAVAVSGDRVFVSKGYSVGSALLQIERSDDGRWNVSEIWRNSRVMKTKFSNVVVRDGYVYGLDEGILQCIDLATGKSQWKETAGRFGYGQTLLIGDLLLVTTETQGDFVLVEASPDRLKVLGRSPMIEGQTWNPPALAGSLLLVRNAQWAACYRLPVEP